ncbi:MAG: hypothetical protein QM796_10495 [Chthoniobacteraceae bacterium]
MSVLIIFAAVLALLSLYGLALLAVGMVSAPLGMEDRLGFHLVKNPYAEKPGAARG